MNPKPTLLVSFAAAALWAGCASSGPSTERSAAAGAAIGALGGAVIGNNVGGGGHHPLAGAAIGAAAGGIAGAAVGNRIDQRQGTAYSTIPPTTTSADTNAGYVQQPPPAPTSQPQDNYSPQPSPTAVWIQGHYEYTGNGRDYQWTPGHWETPPAGARNYVAAHWEQRPQGYLWVPGTWQ